MTVLRTRSAGTDTVLCVLCRCLIFRNQIVSVGNSGWRGMSLMDRSRMKFAQTGRLSVAQPLHAFVEREALLGTGISATAFWSGLADLVRDFGQRNRQLLEVRDSLQSRIDT